MRDPRTQTTERVLLHDDSAAAWAVIDTIGSPVLILDLDLRIVEANRAFCDAFGLQHAHIEGRSVDDLDGQWRIPGLRELLESFLLGRLAITACEVGCEVSGIGHRAVMLDVRLVSGVEGRFESMILLTVNDNTAARAAEEQRAAELRRKEFNLEEMTHRISNSLTIITALLQYKAKVAESHETRSVLNEIHHRILSIASVQKLLQVPANRQQVALDPLLTALCENLSQGMTSRGSAIGMSVQTGGAVVDSAAAVNIGLVVTELVINALKHAFPPGRSEGRIVISYEATEAGWILRVADNGIGARLSGPPSVRRGLGTFIVDALARQLDAQVDVAVKAGRVTTLTHRIPVDEPLSPHLVTV